MATLRSVSFPERKGWRKVEGFLVGAVKWVVVPVIMAIGLVLAVTIVRATKKDGERVAAYAGLFAGLVAGSGFAITQLAGNGSRRYEGDFHFSELAVVVGLIIGFGLPYLVLLLPRLRGLVGLLALILSAASSLALLNYLFIGAVRDFTMLLSMSLLFGVLVYLVFNGERLKEILVIFK